MSVNFSTPTRSTFRSSRLPWSLTYSDHWSTTILAQERNFRQTSTPISSGFYRNSPALKSFDSGLSSLSYRITDAATVLSEPPTMALSCGSRWPSLYCQSHEAGHCQHVVRNNKHQMMYCSIHSRRRLRLQDAHGTSIGRNLATVWCVMPIDWRHLWTYMRRCSACSMSKDFSWRWIFFLGDIFGAYYVWEILETMR